MRGREGERGASSIILDPFGVFRTHSKREIHTQWGVTSICAALKSSVSGGATTPLVFFKCFKSHRIFALWR